MEAPDTGTVAGYAAAIVGALGSVFVGLRALRTQNSNAAVTEASNEANITAIETYKVLVSELREARANADARADKFAEERNEAWRQFYTSQGKLEALTEQIETLNKEIELLRKEVAHLRAQAAAS